MKSKFTQMPSKQYFFGVAAQSLKGASKLMAALCFFLIFGISCSYAQAPSISYPSPLVLNPYIAARFVPTNTGGAVPGGANNLATESSIIVTDVVADTSRNVYFTGSNSTVVTKLVGNINTSVGSGFKNPAGLAVDNAGNIFVADKGNNAVKEIQAAGGAVVTLATVSGLTGIALTTADSIYVSTATAVERIPAAGGTPVTLKTGFTAIKGVAVDATGNIYVDDNGASAIKEVLASNNSTVILASGLTDISGMAVDGSGDLYYTQSTVINDLLYTFLMEIFPGGGPPYQLGLFQDAISVYLDKTGNIYTEGQISASSNGRYIYEIPFGIYTISPLPPAGLTFDHKTGIFSGTPLLITPATNYTITAYNSSGSSSTILNLATTAAAKPNISYATPQTYYTGAPESITPVNTGGLVPSVEPVEYLKLTASVSGIAVDGSGNVYQAQLSGTSVVKSRPDGTEPVTVGSGFNNTTGVVTDAAGNVFVVDNGNKMVKEVLASNGSTVTYATGFSSPQGIAIDGSGNLYISDAGTNIVYKVPAGGGSKTTLISGLIKPTGVAVDPAGNVYVANTGANTVLELPAGGSSTVAFGSGFNAPYGIAADPAGNVFVTDGGNHALKRIPAGGGNPVTIGYGTVFKTPSAIALDANGNIYVDDWGNQSQFEFNPGYLVNPTLPTGLSIDEASGIISGTPTVARPKTNYIVSTRNSGGVSVATVEITVNPLPAPTVSYVSPQVYAINAAITPLSPKSNAVFPSSIDEGVASYATGLTSNEGIAVNAAGEAYVAETTSNQVVKIEPDGVTTTVVGSGFSGPTDVALDAAGNLYVADFGNKAVKEVTTGGTILTLGSGFSEPISVAVDGSGNVYVADEAKGVFEIPAGNGTPVTLAGGIVSTPTSIAVDGYGNVFAGDDNVYEILASNHNTVMVYQNNFNRTVNSITVDGGGNVYFCSGLSNASGIGIYELPAGSASVLLNFGTTAGSDYIYLDVTVAGVLYMSDPTLGTVIKGIPHGGYYISNSLPLGLSLNANTGAISGTPTTVTPATNYTITGYNLTGSGSATVNIATVSGTNTSLSGLAISQGTLRPAFATGTKSYAVTEASTVSSITLTPTTSTTTATVLINGMAVASGTASAAIPLVVGPNTIQVAVTDNGGNSVSNYTLTVTRTGNPSLAGLTVNPGTLSPAFNSTVTSYTTTLPAGATSITVTPTLVDSTGTVTVNGKQLATGTASPNIQLSVGANTITVVTTSADGANTKTYTITATRPSANDNLSFLSLSTGALSPTFNANTLSYTSSVANTVTTTTVKPTTADANATVKVNGTTVTSGTNSSPISLNVGANVINVVVTAQDGSTTKTYSITVTRAASSNANLSLFKISRGTLTPAFSSTTTSYTASVVNGVTSMTVTPTAAASTATITVDGTAVASGSASGPIALAVGSNTITTIVTAPDGVTTQTYTLVVSRASGPADSFVPVAAGTDISVSKPEETPTLADDGIIVHQAVSPNGDGINDFLQIDNIGQYPDNRLTIMNRNGQMIFEAKGYDNSSKVFDGHSNKNGQMQLPGTYFYELDYTVKGITKTKTGFIVLKY